jgi:predicted MFS family arabinose efflux permease
MGALGAVVGLLLGGVLTEYLSWRWILFVNLPIALAVLARTSMLVEGDREHGGIDVPGAITATLGLGALVYAINRANQDGWTGGPVPMFGAVGAVLLITFVLIQRRSATPMLPPAVLTHRGRLGAYLVMFLMGAGMLATFYFLTLYMQVVKGYAPMRTGLAYLPFAVGALIGASTLGPRLLAHTSQRTVIMVGMALAAAGMAWFSRLTPDQNALVVLLPAQLVAAIGLGLGSVAATAAAVRGVAPKDTGAAAGVVNTTLQVGGALGLAILATIATRTASNQPPGTALPDALTDGYTTGILAGGVLYVAALAVAALTLSPGGGQHAVAAGQ